MTKEELLKLKQHIENLSEEEKKQRDIYLRRIAEGKIAGPQVGYPSIDKPWLKYYRENPIKEIDPHQTIYQLVFDQENMNDDALSYLGVTWSYKKLKRQTDKCADSFSKLGIKEKDTVLIGVSNTPEAVVALLALNKIGAVSKWFDLRASSNDIIKYANSSNCKCMVAFDMILPKVEKAIDKTKLENVLVMSPASTLPVIKRKLYDLKNKKEGTYQKMPDDKRFMKFSDFVKHGDENAKVEEVEFDKNRPSIMIQSSGTTGKPKTIVHSDYSVTHYANVLPYSDVPVGKGKTALDALPPWIAYGLCCTIIYPLSVGTKIELCPDFDPDALYRYADKFSIAFVAPFHVRYFRENFDKLPSKKLRLFRDQAECITSGGDKMGIEENRDCEEKFGKSLINGYGNNEGLGAITINPFLYNKYGTVGIPKYQETIISYDNENKCELPYDENGEICVLTDSKFLEYEGDEKSTKEAKKVHEDGKVWLHTGDIGHIDRDGYLTLGGRARRVIVRLGFKISAYTIEDEILANPLVKECVAISVPDDAEEHVPMAYVLLKDEVKEEKETAEELIKDKCYEDLKEYEVPKYIKVVDELPYTQNGKYDFVSLEEKGAEYVKSLQNNKKTLKKS